uniref:Uncharacterized protein n=1 Tax=Cucumis melo TaxID=3656 RepID=A0A9I9EK86_CUCME
MHVVMNTKIYKIGKIGQQSHTAVNEFDRFDLSLILTRAGLVLQESIGAVKSYWSN